MHQPNPFHEFAIQGHTGPKERFAYLALVGMGILLSLACLVLEFVAVPNPDEHGFWSLFGLVGFGISVTFAYILKHAQERGH